MTSLLAVSSKMAVRSWPADLGCPRPGVFDCERLNKTFKKAFGAIAGPAFKHRFGELAGKCLCGGLCERCICANDRYHIDPTFVKTGASDNYKTVRFM